MSFNTKSEMNEDNSVRVSFILKIIICLNNNNKFCHQATFLIQSIIFIQKSDSTLKNNPDKSLSRSFSNKPDSVEKVTSSENQLTSESQLNRGVYLFVICQHESSIKIISISKCKSEVISQHSFLDKNVSSTSRRVHAQSTSGQHVNQR